MPRAVRWWVIVLAHLCRAAQPAHAQGTSSIIGTVVDAATSTVIASAEVWVQSQNAPVFTDSLGRFVIRGLSAGVTTIHVRRLGYSAFNDTVSILAGAETRRDVKLLKQPLMLDTLTTRAAARKYISPGLQAFEERRRMGIGQFITDSVLRKHDNGSLATVISRLTGVRVVPSRGSYYVSSRRGKATIRDLPQADPFDRTSPRGCWVAVYLDGMPIYQGTEGSKAPDFQRLSAIDYGAIEYYAGGASVPQQYAGIKATDCGVMLLWTRER